MPTPTYTELLATAKQALSDLLAGALSVSVDGKTYTKSSLRQLRDVIVFLEGMVAHGETTPPRARTRVMRP